MKNPEYDRENPELDRENPLFFVKATFTTRNKLRVTAKLITCDFNPIGPCFTEFPGISRKYC